MSPTIPAPLAGPARRLTGTLGSVVGSRLPGRKAAPGPAASPAPAEEARGVQFPLDSTGTRSTGHLAKEVVADALALCDPAAAERVRHTSDWRKGYIEPFTELVTVAMDDAAVWNDVAATALHALQSRMVAVEGGVETPMTEYLDTATPRFAFDTEVVTGRGPAVEDLVLPYRGSELRGASLRTQLEKWVGAGVIEPSCAEALLRVQQNPEWLSLPGRTMLVLGLGSEMGPARTLLRWGADVMGVDLPTSPVWDELRASVPATAGTLRIPTRDGRAGADLLTELPELAAWAGSAAPHPVTMGTYLYADGGAHVRLSSAADALAEHLLEHGAADALAYLATPMDTFVVPEDVRTQAVRAFAARGATDPRTLAGRASRGALFQPNYPEGSGPGVHDALVPQQGPNYTLAKRVQRWRATTALAEGHTVSINVAPSTRTRSVTKNTGLALAYKGAPAFGIEILDPETSSTMLAALLAHDLNVAAPPYAHPWEHEASGAASGGLWRQPYLPRTALTVAAVLGTVKR